MAFELSVQKEIICPKCSVNNLDWDHTRFFINRYNISFETVCVKLGRTNNQEGATNYYNSDK